MRRCRSRMEAGRRNGGRASASRSRWGERRAGRGGGGLHDLHFILELAEDPTYHALVRSAPDLEREIAVPLTRAGAAALDALADRLRHWAAVADVSTYDLEVGISRALDSVAARLT